MNWKELQETFGKNLKVICERQKFSPSSGVNVSAFGSVKLDDDGGFDLDRYLNIIDPHDGTGFTLKLFEYTGIGPEYPNSRLNLEGFLGQIDYHASVLQQISDVVTFELETMEKLRHLITNTLDLVPGDGEQR